MNKPWTYLLMATLVVGLGMNVTSCKDDNDDENNERTPEEIAQDPYAKESEAADALYRLVSQLSICDSLPNDWKTATFEPKAGKVLDQSQPRVRTIAVNNAAEAVARYNSLTGKELPATTITDTYTVTGVGTLQLNVGGAGTIATIDVDVKQMPQLAQLRLVSVADMGENGHFKGEPYYCFGDVVMDQDSCYWICVRPAFSPNGKEDTHWMSFHLTDKNIKTCYKGGCYEQKYPVDLGVNKEKMHYLAQLMNVLAYPYIYKEIDSNEMEKDPTQIGIGGLQKAAMPVDSMARQSALWDQKKIWEKIMPVGYKPNEVETFKRRFGMDLTFIYEKASVSLIGSKLTVKTVQYSDPTTVYLDDPIYEKIPVDMSEIAFDVTQNYSTKGRRTNDKCTVPDAFVVRYKSGYQLSSNLIFSPSATDSIPGVTTIHRFNACKGTQIFDKGSYKKEQAEPKMILAKNGKFYKSEAGCAIDKTDPVALVVYVGDSADASGKYHGLAMSFDKISEVKWDEDATTKLCIEGTSSNKKTWEHQNDGVSRTQKLCEDGHKHAAAKAAWEFQVDGFEPDDYGCSNWFLPTAWQVMMAVRGLGGTANYIENNQDWACNLKTKLGDDLKNAGIESFNAEFDCWTSTEYPSTTFANTEAVYFKYVGLYNMFFGTVFKTQKLAVRPFIAF